MFPEGAADRRKYFNHYCRNHDAVRFDKEASEGLVFPQVPDHGFRFWLSPGRLPLPGLKPTASKPTTTNPTPMKHFHASIALVAACLLAAATNHAADGYGRNATGGAGGATVTVTTAAQLRQYAESTTTYIINVSGTIDLGSSGRVNVKGNKTLHGTSSSATIKGTLNVQNVSNVIIDHLNVTANTGSAGSNDGITVHNSRNVYITKCNVYDCTDGGIDMRTGATDLTISWCKFYYTRDNGHNFVNLMGAADTDTPTGNVTYHHNWYSTGCKERMPLARFGQVHMYNNYFACSGNNYCSWARLNSQLRMENNYYQSVKDSLRKYQSGKIWSSGNTFNNCSGTSYTGKDSGVFTPNYGYTLDATANVPSRVQGGAGNR
jgi:pectate lyase